jgi:hypothetical protein
MNVLILHLSAQDATDKNTRQWKKVLYQCDFKNMPIILKSYSGIMPLLKSIAPFNTQAAYKKEGFSSLLFCPMKSPIKNYGRGT